MSHSIYSAHKSWERCDCVLKQNKRQVEGRHGAAKQKWIKNNPETVRIFKTVIKYYRAKGGRIQDLARVFSLSTKTVQKWTYEVINPGTLKKINFRKSKVRKQIWSVKHSTYEQMVKIKQRLLNLLRTKSAREIDIRRLLLDEH